MLIESRIVQTINPSIEANLFLVSVEIVIVIVVVVAAIITRIGFFISYGWSITILIGFIVDNLAEPKRNGSMICVKSTLNI